MWRCPHCGTPQAEASRCWVCRRSSTSCGTCRHFRRAVAANLGYCGLDRSRRPLAGDELRGCWQERPAVAESAEGTGSPSRPLPTADPLGTASARRLEFVEIGGTPSSDGVTAARRPGRTPRATATPETVEEAAAERAAPLPPPLDEPRWSLWGDLER